MATVKIECPKCHRPYKVTDSAIGRKVKCAHQACGESFLAAVAMSSRRPADADIVFDEAGENLSDPEQWNPPTPPKLPKETHSKSKFLTVVATVLLIAAVAAGIRFAIQPGNHLGVSPDLAGKDVAKQANAHPARQQMVDLIYFTDVVLRMLQETDDESLAREYLDRWEAKRIALEKIDVAENSLGVIGGHLNSIHEKIYPRKPERRYSLAFGWRDASEWSANRDSEESIRLAQSHLMRAFNIPWKETQNSKIFATKYSQLRGLCRSIADSSDPLPSGLPRPIDAVEANKLIRDLEILYSELPFPPRLPPPHKREEADQTEFPAWIDKQFQRHYLTDSERHFYGLAIDVIQSRLRPPVFADDLDGKTKALNYAEKYSATLGLLRRVPN